MEAVKQFGREITGKVFDADFGTYADFKNHVLLTLKNNREIKEPVKEKIREKISSFEQLFAESGCSHDNMRSIAERAGNDLLKDLPLAKQRLEIVDDDIFSFEIREEDWEKITSLYGIQKLTDGIAYKGGCARVVARHIFKYEQNKADLASDFRDVDVYAVDGSNHAQIMETYGADSKGISYLNDFSEENIKKKFTFDDLTINQLFVTNNRIYFTKPAFQDLKSGYAGFAAQGQNFYGKQSIEVDGKIFYMPTQLVRGIKFLIEGKIDLLKIKKYNLNKENLDATFFGKNLLTLVMKIYKEKPQMRRELLLNIGGLLKFIGYIESEADLFDQLRSWIEEYNFRILNSSFSLERDANWKLTKYIKIALEHVIHELDGVKDEKEEKIDVSGGDEDLRFGLGFNQIKEPSDFHEKMTKFDSEVMSSYVGSTS